MPEVGVGASVPRLRSGLRVSQVGAPFDSPCATVKCREWESNPHVPFGTRDFKSLAYASFATPAVELEAAAGIEPAYRGFADLRLTTWLPRHTISYSSGEKQRIVGNLALSRVSYLPINRNLSKKRNQNNFKLF